MLIGPVASKRLATAISSFPSASLKIDIPAVTPAPTAVKPFMASRLVSIVSLPHRELKDRTPRYICLCP